MVITLIALVILLIGGVALIRSSDTSALIAGNLAFKRDLMNQGEIAMQQVKTVLSTGALKSEASRTQDLLAQNYSASVLASDPVSGVPAILKTDAAFAASNMSLPDLSTASGAVKIRYVIDRQCASAGAYDSGTCVPAPTDTPPDKGGSDFLKKPGPGTRPVYRISVMVSGPRNTQAFLQTTSAL